MNRTVSVSKHEAEVRRITNPPGESDSSAETRVRISNPMTNPIRHPKHEAKKSPGALPCQSRLTFPPYTAGSYTPGQMPVSLLLSSQVQILVVRGGLQGSRGRGMCAIAVPIMEAPVQGGREHWDN